MSRKLLLVITVLAGLIFTATIGVLAREPGQSIPPDFAQVTSGVGVALYQKDYAGGSPDFVQVVDFSQGASLRLLHGPLTELGAGQGVYGGDNPKFARQALADVWTAFSSSSPGAFCMTNGQFFSTSENPTRLAFPIKVNGVVVSDGYGINEFPNEKLMLELWDERADINPLSAQALKDSSALNIIVGLAEDADKNPASLTGRTFVGLADADQDGEYETVLLFNSKTASQAGAALVLRSFGAAKVMMLDGGGSTQLSCQGTAYVSGDRMLPQTLATLSGDVQPYAADVVSSPNYPVLLAGESMEILLELRNVGLESWQASRYGLVNISNPWGQPEVLVGLHDVNPGQSVIFSWNSEPFDDWGVFVSEWRLEVEGESLTGGEVTFTAIVVPEEMADKKAELERQVAEWVQSQTVNVEQLVLQWIQERLTEGVNNVFEQICSGTSALLPLGMVVWFGSRCKRREDANAHE